MADRDEDRVTVTAAEAAVFFGLSPTSTRVIRELLGDPNEPLEGPASRGAGRGRHRLVYADTLVAQRMRRKQKVSSRPTVASLSRDLAALRADVDGLSGLDTGAQSRPARAVRPDGRHVRGHEAVAAGGTGFLAAPQDVTRADLFSEIADLRARHQADQDTIRRLEYQRAKSRAAGDALRDALREQGEAIDLRRQAEAHADRAFELALAAEKLRDDGSEPPEPPEPPTQR